MNSEKGKFSPNYSWNEDDAIFDVSYLEQVVVR